MFKLHKLEDRIVLDAAAMIEAIDLERSASPVSIESGALPFDLPSVWPEMSGQTEVLQGDDDLLDTLAMLDPGPLPSVSVEGIAADTADDFSDNSGELERGQQRTRIEISASRLDSVLGLPEYCLSIPFAVAMTDGGPGAQSLSLSLEYQTSDRVDIASGAPDAIDTDVGEVLDSLMDELADDFDFDAIAGHPGDSDGVLEPVSPGSAGERGATYNVESNGSVSAWQPAMSTVASNAAMSEVVDTGRHGLPIIIPGPMTACAGEGLPISGIALNADSSALFNMPEAALLSGLRLHLDVAHGALYRGAETVEFLTGSVDAINAALSGLEYRSAEEFGGEDALALRLSLEETGNNAEQRM